MKIEPNTTIVDVSLNLSGSITGIPAALDQLPVGDRIGFDDLPDLGEDVEDIGQTWTPDLVGRQLDIELPLYDTLGQEKQPYSTDLVKMKSVVTVGEGWVQSITEGRPFSSLKAGEMVDLPHLSFLGRGDNMRFAGEIGRVYGIGFSQNKNDTFVNALLSFVYIVSSEDGDGTLLMNLGGDVIPVFSHVTENGVTRLIKWLEATYLLLQNMYVIFDTTGAVEPPAPAEAGKWSFDNLFINNLKTNVLNSDWESAPVDFDAPSWNDLYVFLVHSSYLGFDLKGIYNERHVIQPKAAKGTFDFYGINFIVEASENNYSQSDNAIYVANIREIYPVDYILNNWQTRAKRIVRKWISHKGITAYDGSINLSAWSANSASYSPDPKNAYMKVVTRYMYVLHPYTTIFEGAGKTFKALNLRIFGLNKKTKFNGEVGHMYGFTIDLGSGASFGSDEAITFAYLVTSKDGDGIAIYSMAGMCSALYTDVMVNGRRERKGWGEYIDLSSITTYRIVYDPTGAIEKPPAPVLDRWGWENVCVFNDTTYPNDISDPDMGYPVMFNAPTYEVLSQFLFASRLMSVDKTAGNTEQITIDQVLNKPGSVKLQSLVVAREGTDFLAQNGSWVFCQNTASGQQLMVDLSTAEASKIGEYQESAEATTVDGYIPNSMYMYNPSEAPTPATATVKIRMRFRPVYDET
jgi:hypothetical protein|nr:MAG TPA: hypothetical protein [Caudoviricetes sp.]